MIAAALIAVAIATSFVAGRLSRGRQVQHPLAARDITARDLERMLGLEPTR